MTEPQPGPSGPVDLHLHSRASDGSLGPAELVRKAQAAGLQGAALTDHDTVEGVSEFLAEAEILGLPALAGVELSLDTADLLPHLPAGARPERGTFHLLGLNAARRPCIPATLDQLKLWREERNQAIFDKLLTLGYQVRPEQMRKLAGGGVVGRVHFALALVEAGYFQRLSQVFERLLDKSGPAYVERKRLAIRRGIEMIREAGWAPVLAHPVSLGLTSDHWPRLIELFRDWGLLGLEVRHPQMKEDASAFFLTLARKNRLTPTAGSDFHGDGKPGVPLDWVGRHAPRFSWEMVNDLKKGLES